GPVGRPGDVSAQHVHSPGLYRCDDAGPLHLHRIELQAKLPRDDGEDLAVVTGEAILRRNDARHLGGRCGGQLSRLDEFVVRREGSREGQSDEGRGCGGIQHNSLVHFASLSKLLSTSPSSPDSTSTHGWILGIRRNFASLVAMGLIPYYENDKRFFPHY